MTSRTWTGCHGPVDCRTDQRRSSEREKRPVVTGDHRGPGPGTGGGVVPFFRPRVTPSPVTPLSVLGRTVTRVVVVCEVFHRTEGREVPLRRRDGEVFPIVLQSLSLE